MDDWQLIEAAPRGKKIWATTEYYFPEVDVLELHEKEIKYYEEKHYKNGNIKQIPKTRKILLDENDNEIWHTHWTPLPKFP